jgi:hypothetical protein
MKNLLAENMLRFGAKNLHEESIQNLQRLIEQTLTNITDGAVIAGATASNTTNVSAMTKFGQSGYTITGTIAENKCIRKEAGQPKTKWTIANKSVKAAHYVKVGDKVISGSSASSMMVTLGDLTDQAVEAAGNGIYALYRALQGVKTGMKSYGLTSTSGLAIVLNGGKGVVNNYFFNIKTGWQDVANNFGSSILRVMIGIGALKPTGTSTNNLIDMGLKIKANGTAKDYLGKAARPTVSDLTDTESETLKAIGPISVEGDPATNKMINNEDAAIPVVKAFCARYFQAYIDSVAAKFKEYINMRAKAALVPIETLSGLINLIDTWKKTQKLNDYTNEALDKLFVVYRPTTSRSGGVTGARTTSGSTSGAEGQMGAPKQ